MSPTLSMSRASLPVLTKALSNLDHLLDKGAAHAQERKYEPAALTAYRLAPDMLPFSRQIQIACDIAKNGIARISGIEAPKFEDTESSFDELKARIQKTLQWLNTVPNEKLDGTEDKSITFPAGRDKTMTMQGADYLCHWVLPNVYFHVCMAYAILRTNGVDVGKADFLAGTQRT